MNFLLKNLYEMILKMNLYNILLFVYQSGGKEAVRRFITPPQSVIEKIGNKKVPLAVQIEERDEMVEETLEFLESLTDEDFVNPD